MLTLTLINFLVYELQSIHPKQNKTQIKHESNNLRMLQTGRKSH